MTCLLVLSSSDCLCVAAISHAMARDGSSGGVIRLVIIEATGIEKEVILGEGNVR